MRYSYIILLIITELFFAYQFVLRVLPSMIITEIMEKFQIDATSFGILSAVYYFSYALMQIPVGLLLDRYGPRYIVALSAFICIVGNLTFIYSSNFHLALVGRFLIGLGSIAGFLGASKAISIGFDKKYFNYLMNVTFICGYLGPLISSKLPFVIHDMGWEKLLLNLSIFAGIIGLILLLLPVKYSKQTQNDQSVVKSLGAVFKNPRLLLVAVCGLLQVGPLEAFADVWGVEYLTKIYGYKPHQAATLTAMIYLGLCVGGPLVSYFAEKTKSHYYTASACGFIMCLIFLFIINNNYLPYNLLLILMFVIGALSACQIITFAINCSALPTHIGVVTAMTNMVIMSAGSFFNFIIGHSLDLHNDGNLADSGTVIYNELAFQKSFAIFPITLIIGSIGFIILNRFKNDRN